ncbi:Apoptotic atpase, partial [Globisporangium splendens]
MHAFKLCATLALAALYQAEAIRMINFSSKVATATEDTDRPGICKDTTECSSGYECTALQTTRDATVAVKQCLPKAVESDVCAGQYAGLCPTFSSWKSPYNQISSVCTYMTADNCAKDTSAKSVKGELMCVAGAQDHDGNEIEVIYGCVDYDPKNKKLLFGDSDKSFKLSKTLDTAAALTDSCLNTNANSTSGLLCSGQGTCLPTTIASLEYTCKCNVGYSGNYCDKVESNKCALPGQCATGVCNLTTKECECAAGTTGNQCSECDSTSSKACNSKGTCSNTTCVCNDGWEGLQCTKQVKKTTVKSTVNSTASSSNSTAAATSGAAPASNAITPLMFAIASVLIAAVVN